MIKGRSRITRHHIIYVMSCDNKGRSHDIITRHHMIAKKQLNLKEHCVLILLKVKRTIELYHAFTKDKQKWLGLGLGLEL